MTQSPTYLAWKKFRKNIPAMTGLGYVALCILIAILGYIIAPDRSPHANFQVLELAKKPPGTRATLLLVPQKGVDDAFKFSQLLTGKPQTVLPKPISPGSDIQVVRSRVIFTSIAGAKDSLALSAFGTNLSEPEFRKKHVKNIHYLLGTDGYGRDLLSRIMLGARVSLAIGLMSVLISLVIGITLGVIAGFYGGWIDRAIMWLVSVMWAIPTLLMALAISFVLGKGFWQLFVAIGLSMWVEVARIVRGQVMGVRELPYTEAATALGYRPGRIMFRHVLPNVASPIIVIAVANFGAAVLIESGLSFLGIGVEPPIPSWGRMIYEGYTYIMFENGQWLAFFPGFALIFLVISINLIGIGIRDAWDVKL